MLWGIRCISLELRCRESCVRVLTVPRPRSSLHGGNAYTRSERFGNAIRLCGGRFLLSMGPRLVSTSFRRCGGIWDDAGTRPMHSGKTDCGIEEIRGTISFSRGQEVC